MFLNKLDSRASHENDSKLGVNALYYAIPHLVQHDVKRRHGGRGKSSTRHHKGLKWRHSTVRYRIKYSMMEYVSWQQEIEKFIYYNSK